MNPEDMKSAWRDTTRSLSSESKGIKTADDMRHGTPLTSLERLQKRYRLFAIAGMTACPTSLIFLNQRIFPHNNGIWLAIAFAVYFITCFTMDWWLYYAIGSIDCVRMSVREVSEKAMFYRKRHLQFVMILIPFALILFGWLAYVNSGDIYLLAGMATGAFFGLAIGLYHLSQFLRDYKNIE